MTHGSDDHETRGAGSAGGSEEGESGKEASLPDFSEELETGRDDGEVEPTACAVELEGDDHDGAVPTEELGFDPIDPDRPVLVWDGTCGFCRRSLDYIRDRTGPRIHSVPYQKVHAHFEHVDESDFEEAVHLIEPGGRITSGAEAVYGALSYAPDGGWAERLYRLLPPFAAASERGYRFVAEHRPLVTRLSRWFVGEDLRRSRFQWARWLFLRLLGLVFLIAFLSLGSQLEGLIGGQGIAPAADLMARVRGPASDAGFWQLPTLFWWIDPTDAALWGTTIAGAALSTGLVAGLWPRFILPLLWGSYLSFCTISGPFLGYQWDILLLEVALLAWFVAPRGFWTLTRSPPVDRMPVFLLHWLGFRLMFMSGIAKIGSGDPTWVDGSALTYHFWTQPLPTWTAYWVHWLPDLVLRFGTWATLVVEVLVPIFVFAPRRLRRWAGYAFIGLQLLIFATGNYTFFNLLSIGVLLFLIDDSVWRSLVPSWLSARVDIPRQRSRSVWERARGWAVVAAGVVVLGVTAVKFERSFPADLDFRGLGVPSSINLGLDSVGGVVRSADDVAVDLLETLPLGDDLRRGASSFVDATGPFRTFNTYGLFADMTTQRPEILVQGSRDGEEWRTYVFRWKPDARNKRPRFVEPHQPRLDWQMWFQALRLERYHEARGGCGYSKWFVRFQRRLLEGSRPVLDLLAFDPFEGEPPRYVRTLIYDYEFTRPSEGGDAWWQRSNRRIYCPTLTLKDGRLRAVRDDA